VELGLTDKVAVVTGASRGIGRAVVDALLEEGANVAAGARSVEGLAGLDRVVAVAVDLARPDGPARLVDAAVDAFGGVDFLVNNVAAARLHPDGFESTSDDDWHFAFDATFMSAVRATRAALPHLRARGGAIVNVSSLNGRAPAVGAWEYSAMKAAMNNLSDALAQELAPAGVRVNVVSPGPVRTDMQLSPGGAAWTAADRLGETVDEYVARVEQALPIRRFAEPREVADVVVSLLSDRFGYVTGADVAVDGAMHP
jgi:NAD(P)-dependent dehydrogenase (short-subunit alcohol dehydrogenase family)